MPTKTSVSLSFRPPTTATAAEIRQLPLNSETLSRSITRNTTLLPKKKKPSLHAECQSTSFDRSLTTFDQIPTNDHSYSLEHTSPFSSKPALH